MESSSEFSEASRSGVSTHLVDASVACFIILCGGVVLYGSRKLGAEWTSDGPGSGYFPFYIGLILSISGLGILFQALMGKKKNTEIFVDKEQLGRVLSVLLPACVYVVGIQFLGIYLASAIYIAVFMVILGKYSWLRSVVVAGCVNTLFFMMFEVWFKVPLFKGKFEPLSFLGY